MTIYPLISHADAQSILAWRQDQPITVAQFLSDVHQLAAALPAGQHILNVCADRYRFSVGLGAALVTGKISLLPSTLTPEMVRQVTLFASDAFYLSDQAQTLDMPCVRWAQAMETPVPSKAETGEGSFDIPQIPASQTAAIVFTSGSTGSPVAHRKSWGGLVQSARAEAERLGMQDGRCHSIVATVAPQHMYGFESSVLLAWHSGAALTAGHPFYPADICTALAAAPSPCLFVTTPIHLKTLLAAGVRIPAPQTVLSATAPLSRQLAIDVEAVLKVPVLEIYGSTETGQVATRRTSETLEWTLFPGITLTSESGRIWAAGGHIDQPTPLADELEMVSRSRFLLHGRTADLINIAGKRSSIAYLNHQLHAVPGVVDGAFLLPEDGDGMDTGVTRLMAFVVAPGLTQNTLLAALRERIDPAFMPRPLIWVDSLPRNGTGKLPRSALVALAQGRHRAGVDHAL